MQMIDWVQGNTSELEHADVCLCLSKLLLELGIIHERIISTTLIFNVTIDLFIFSFAY